MPRALLVGRNPAKLEAISTECGGLPGPPTWVPLWQPRVLRLLRCPDHGPARGAIRQAVAAGKHIYCEKPVAGSLESALDL